MNMMFILDSWHRKECWARTLLTKTHISGDQLFDRNNFLKLSTSLTCKMGIMVFPIALRQTNEKYSYPKVGPA